MQPTQILDRSTQLSLLQDPCNLLNRKALPLHNKTSVLLDPILSQNSHSSWSDLLRACQTRLLRIVDQPMLKEMAERVTPPFDQKRFSLGLGYKGGGCGVANQLRKRVRIGRR